MRILKVLLIGLLVGMVVCAVLLPENAQKVQILDGIGKGIFATFGVMMLGYVIRLRRFLRQRNRVPLDFRPIRKPVVVDGSNVMHWGGDPSLNVLSKVLKELEIRGYDPLVYFDANVGYKLFDKHMCSADMADQLGLQTSQVVNAPSRTPADAILLERAMKDNLRVVTNDRFLDWKSQFPKVGERGFLVKGIWKEGNVILLGLGRGAGARNVRRSQGMSAGAEQRIAS